MKLKQLCVHWPPDIAVAARRLGAIKPDLDDTITSAYKDPGARHHIILSLTKADGAEYGVVLILPEHVLDNATLFITHHLPPTLRDVGEIDI